MVMIDPAPILPFSLRLIVNAIAAMRIKEKETEKDSGT